MKNVEKLQQAHDLLLEEYVSSKNENVGKAMSLIHQFIIDNSPVKKTGLSACDFVSKDTVRPSLQYIFHDNELKAAVATDGHALFVNPAEYVDSTEKPSDCKQKFDYDGYSGLIRDKYGKVVINDNVINYPAWRFVFPKDESLQPLNVREDLQQVRDRFATAVKLNKNCAKIRKLNGFCGGMCVDTEKEVWISDTLVEYILRAGTDGWMCDKDNPSRRCIVKYWPDGRKLLLMPINGRDNSHEGYDPVNKIFFLQY